LPRSTQTHPALSTRDLSGTFNLYAVTTFRDSSFIAVNEGLVLLAAHCPCHARIVTKLPLSRSARPPCACSCTFSNYQCMNVLESRHPAMAENDFFPNTLLNRNQSPNSSSSLTQSAHIARRFPANACWSHPHHDPPPSQSQPQHQHQHTSPSPSASASAPQTPIWIWNPLPWV
jgi:hypothetical protein